MHAGTGLLVNREYGCRKEVDDIRTLSQWAVGSKLGQGTDGFSYGGMSLLGSGYCYRIGKEFVLAKAHGT